jgi:excisionase family DNA binding protein
MSFHGCPGSVDEVQTLIDELGDPHGRPGWRGLKRWSYIAGAGDRQKEIDAMSMEEMIEEVVRKVLREELPKLLIRETHPVDPFAPLTPAEAGQLAGCTAETVRRAVRAGALKHTTRGRSILLDRGDVLRWAGRSAPAVDLAASARQALARARAR